MMLLYLRKSWLWHGRRFGLDITWFNGDMTRVTLKVSHQISGCCKKRPQQAFRFSEKRLHLVGAGVRCGQPAEEALVRSGRVLARCPVARHVIGVGDHQLSSVEVRTQNKWDILHPPDDGSGLRGNLHLEILMMEAVGREQAKRRRTLLKACLEGGL